ncbi:MAG: copper chaperone PCu(A)C [Rubrivivax sp.]
MIHPLRHRRGLLQAGLALGAAAYLPPARACEYFAATLRIHHPWARASAPGASSAIVSMQFDEVSKADRLIGVQIDIAEGAEINGRAVDFAIPEGQVTTFGEQGAVQLRLVGLQRPLQIGRSYPMKLAFEHGGVVHAGLNIDFPPTDLKRFF